ncbi:MAG: hypothetical protein IPJ69_11900 [Deltaproteobacteria bacterium]|nr:MAG: hypothetical protein IPJ69_11900 [Deltaproteobacteria bacterium]
MLASFKDAAGGALEALGAAQAARAGVSIVFVDQGRLSEVVRSFTSTNVLDFGINTFAGLTHTTDTLGDPVQGLRKYFGIEGFPGGLNSILPPSKGYPFAELGFSKFI